jgi:PleD family two-component response regulator
MTDRVVLHQKHHDALQSLKKGMDGIVELQKSQARLLEKRAAKKTRRKQHVEEMTSGSRLVRLLVAAPEDVLRMCETLGGINGTKFQLRWQPDIAMACYEASEQDFDIVLVDCTNQTDAICLMGQARKGIPVIVISETENYGADKMAMDTGAADFLAGEDLTPKRLEKSIRYCLKKAC